MLIEFSTTAFQLRYLCVLILRYLKLIDADVRIALIAEEHILVIVPSITKTAVNYRRLLIARPTHPTLRIVHLTCLLPPTQLRILFPALPTKIHYCLSFLSIISILMSFLSAQLLTFMHDCAQLYYTINEKNIERYPFHRQLKKWICALYSQPPSLCQ